MTAVTTIGADPARVDIDAIPGGPVDFTEPVLDANDDAQSLAGWVLAAQVKHDDAVLHTFTTAVVAPTGTPGTAGYNPGGVRVSATGAQTAGWTGWPPAVRWTLWLTPPASEPYPFAAGWVRVTTH